MNDDARSSGNGMRSSGNDARSSGSGAGPSGSGASLDHPDRPDAQQLRLGSEIFAMLGEPTRLELLWLMTSGPVTVGDLVGAVGASRTSVSQHLAKLRRAGVVDVHRQGRTAEYSLRGGHVERLVREGLNHAAHVASGELPHH